MTGEKRILIEEKGKPIELSMDGMKRNMTGEKIMKEEPMERNLKRLKIAIG